MKKKVLILIAVIALGAGGLIIIQSRQKASQQDQDLSAALFAPAPPQQPKPVHSHTPSAPRVPAFQGPAELKKLGPTLPGSQFTGKTREAYDVAKRIPETLAQLPCYCECDRGFGHKSLHTCFTDDHASHCAVCVDEALLAYQLQRDEKLTPEQVRQRIIERYANVPAAH